MTLDAASEGVFDVLVVGAGPAGTAAACAVREAGGSVLLLDRRDFPRPKVCGACLSPRAWGEIEALGLADRLHAEGARTLGRFRVRSSRGELSAPLPSGRSGGYRVVSRDRLDLTLLESAVAEGAEWRVAVAREIRVASDVVHLDVTAPSGGRATLRARAVVLASGLAGFPFDRAGLAAPLIRERSWIGISGTALVDAGVATDDLTMNVADCGYAGVCVLEDGRVNVAAAIDPNVVETEGATGAIERIFEQAGASPGLDLDRFDFRGTPPLTRRPRSRAGERIFLAGDASGYVEPFTGEGMGWALASGRVAGAHAARVAREGWHPSEVVRYEQAWAHRVGRSQRRCARVAWLLRRPRVRAAALGAMTYSTRIRKGVLAPFVRPLAAVTARNGNRDRRRSSWPS